MLNEVKLEKIDELISFTARWDRESPSFPHGPHWALTSQPHLTVEDSE